MPSWVSTFAVDLAEGVCVLRIAVAWLVGFVVVLLLFEIFAPALLDIFLENLGELL